MNTPISDNLIINRETMPVISQLAESIPGGFFIYHADGNQELIYFNSHLPAIFGCDNEDEFREYVGNSFKGIVHPEDYAENESAILSQISENARNNDHVRYRFIRKDGSIGIIDDYGHFSHSDTYGDIYYVFVQDITEQYREEQEHKENVARIMILEDQFGSLYDVDLETGNYENYVNNKLLRDDQINVMVNNGDFFEDTINNAELVVYPDDREGVIKTLNRDFIRKTLEKERYFDWYYRLLPENKPTWARLRFVYKDKEKTHLIVGAFNADAEMTAKQNEERKRKELIAAISGTESTYIVNPETDRFLVLSRNDYLEEHYPAEETYSQSISRYVDNDVFEPDRERTREALRLATVVRNLSDAHEYVVRFREISSDYPHWYEMRAVRLSGSEILIGFSEKDEEIIGRMLFDKMRENYFGLYYINLDTGIAQIMKSGHPENTGGAGTAVQYSALIRKIASASYAETAVFMNRISDIDYVKDYLTANESFSLVYKAYIFEKDRWVSANALVLARHDDGTPSVFALGFSLLDEEACEKEEAKLALQKTTEKLDQEKLRNDILHDIIHSGKWSFYINADDEIVGADVSSEANSILHNDVPADGHSWLNIVHPDDVKYASDAFNATIRDHSCSTPYDVNYRMIDREGRYHWFHSAGRIIRNGDGSGEFFGIHVDITEQMEEQQKRLLGAMPLSNDVLAKANIGMWAFEIDEGQPPRMYDDETMLGLVGLDHQVPPEEAYHAWYDHIDEGSYDLVNDAVAKMMDGEHAEVQYPWHCPDGRTIMVRCGGVRNYGYTKGIRIEGTHQDVTQTLHFDEKERRRAKQLESDLIIAKLRADSLAYISDNEPDLDNAISFFGKQILDIFGCDQVVYRELGGRKLVLNAPGCEEVPETICAECPFSRFDCKAFEKDGTVVMNDCRLGYDGLMAPAACPAKSSFMQMVYSGGDLAGKLTVHFLNNSHTFTESGISIMKTVAIYLGIMIGRIKEKQAEIARIEAESSNRAKTEFLFNMSHDIRTPMNAILGYTDIALNHVNEPEKLSDSLKKIKMSGGHLLSLINDILEMSRIEAGKFELVKAPVCVYEVTETVKAMSQALASTKDITFDTVIGEMKNPYTYADELHINQIVVNLISNAIKYTNPGGTVTYRIEQICNPENGIARFRMTIKDNGIGMTEEFQKHLFESFSREDSSEVAKQEGTGLGLAIVKRIVDIIGGTISVQSRKGYGSTFVVELPMEVMDEAAIERFREEHRENANVFDDSDLTGKKILLVEDNEMNSEIAMEMLSEAGLNVETAENGETAVKKVAEKGADYYDYILMDIQMPVMNGYEATRAIRDLPNGKMIPIIALSANAFEEDKNKSIAAGLNAHIAKPIDVRTLFETMHRVGRQ